MVLLIDQTATSGQCSAAQSPGALRQPSGALQRVDQRGVAADEMPGITRY
jgi:hypothetical protein